MFRRGESHNIFHRIFGKCRKTPEKLHIAFIFVFQEVILLALSHNDVGNAIGRDQLSGFLGDGPRSAVEFPELGIGLFHNIRRPRNPQKTRSLFKDVKFPRCTGKINDLVPYQIADNHTDHCFEVF